jgi:hypothetical protein
MLAYLVQAMGRVRTCPDTLAFRCHSGLSIKHTGVSETPVPAIYRRSVIFIALSARACRRACRQRQLMQCTLMLVSCAAETDYMMRRGLRAQLR